MNGSVKNLCQDNDEGRSLPFVHGHRRPQMKHRMIAAALAAMACTGALAAEIAIDVHGVRSGDGRVYLAVHGPATKETFPSGDALVEGLRAPAYAGDDALRGPGHRPRALCAQRISR